MAKITNNAPRIIGLDGTRLQILPGASIELDATDLVKLAASIVIKALIKIGDLVDHDKAFDLSGVDGVASTTLQKVAPASKLRQAITEIAKLTEAQALKAIESSSDLAMLEKWFHADGRPNVKEAINQRAGALSVPAKNED